MARHGYLWSAGIICSLAMGSLNAISSSGPAYTSSGKTIYTVNPPEGTAIFAATISQVDFFADVAILNPSTLYALDGGRSNIYRVNPKTGASSLVTSTPINSTTGDLDGIALANSTTAYVVGGETNNIYSVNLQTGNSTLLTTITGNPGLTDIAIGNNSTAYVVGFNNSIIYLVNLKTGAYTEITSLEATSPFLDGIGLVDNNTAYVVGGNEGLYRVDLQTGNYTLIPNTSLTADASFIGLPNNTTVYTVGAFGPQFFVVDTLTGNTIIVDIPVSGLAGVAVYPQIDTTDPLIGNNLTFANYLNENAPINVIRLFALLTDSQLPSALMSASPTRNAFATYASQNGYLASSQAVTDHNRQRRFHQRQVEKGSRVAVAEIPWDELSASIPCKPTIKKKPAVAKKSSAIENAPYTAWAAGFGEYAREKSQSQTPRFHMGLGGVVAGFDFNTRGPHVLGCGGAYVHTRVTEQKNAGHADVNQGYLTVYSTLNLSKWYLDLGLWGGYYHIDNQRKISFPEFSATAHSDTHGWQLAPHFEVGYDGFRPCDWGMRDWGFEPFLMADWVANWEKGFKEHGANILNMGQKRRFASLVRGETGLRFHEIATFDWGRMVFTEKVSYAYQKAFHTGHITAFVVGSPGTFTVSTLGTAQNLGVGEFSMLFVFGSQNSTYLDLSYQGEFGSRYQSHQGILELGKDF